MKCPATRTFAQFIASDERTKSSTAETGFSPQIEHQDRETGEDQKHHGQGRHGLGHVIFYLFHDSYVVTPVSRLHTIG